MSEFDSVRFVREFGFVGEIIKTFHPQCWRWEGRVSRISPELLELCGEATYSFSMDMEMSGKVDEFYIVDTALAIHSIPSIESEWFVNGRPPNEKEGETVKSALKRFDPDNIAFVVRVTSRDGDYFQWPYQADVVVYKAPRNSSVLGKWLNGLSH